VGATLRRVRRIAEQGEVSTAGPVGSLLSFQPSNAPPADEVEITVRQLPGSPSRPVRPASARMPCPNPGPVVFLLLLFLLVPATALAQRPLTIAETEDLVRMRHYEGLHEDQAARIGPEGCARLIELLGDPEEARSHAEILLAIGHCGPAGGLEAIAAWADQPREGEIDRATFRAWQALPFALAKLAEHDPRAVARLSARLENEDAPRWTFRRHRGERLKKLRRRAAADCLADTDHPDADASLARAAARITDPALRAHVEQARARGRARRAGAGEVGRGRGTR